MKILDRRGSVLVEVLVMAILMLFLATSLVKLAFNYATVSAKLTGTAAVEKALENSVMAVHSAWMMQGGRVCTSDISLLPALGVVCTGTAEVCNCTCRVTINGAAYPPVTASGTSARCILNGQERDALRNYNFTYRYD